MHPLTALTVFAVIFPAELPDKTALASVILGTRYRSSLVFAGMATAFVCHVVLAVAAGSFLRLLPRRPLEIVISLLFLLGAVLLLRGRHTEEPGEDALQRPSLSPLRVMATSFAVILLAEFGDLTQIVTANLAAKYHDPLSVGLGSVLALWSVGALAILGGQQLLERVPLGLITRAAAGIMLVLAILSLVQVYQS